LVKRQIKRIIPLLLIFSLMASLLHNNVSYVSALGETKSKSALDYTIFSGSNLDDFSFSCWRSNISGDVYTGGNFNYSGSELYLQGDVDAGKEITTNGWITEIEGRNSYVPVVPMPDLDAIIHENGKPYEVFTGSKTYYQHDIIVNDSIKAEENIDFYGSNFKGTCYVIAGGDINYNINTLNQGVEGDILLYSQNGNIKLNGNDITINGIIYAPNGNVEININTFTLNGRIIADSVTFSGSQFNVHGRPGDLDFVKKKAIVKTYTSDEDFLEGDMYRVSIAIPDQLILAENEGIVTPLGHRLNEEIQDGNGFIIKAITDNKVLMPYNDNLSLANGLSGFGEEDLPIPIYGYVREGSWSVIYDSEEEGTPWLSVYWNGRLWGDSKINVYASVSEDGENYGDEIEVKNYDELKEMVGRYIKLDVYMMVSSDGRSPELFDITICGGEEVDLSYTNQPPKVRVVTDGKTKVNDPLDISAVISDDDLLSDINILWSCDSSDLIIDDISALYTTVVAQKAGTYELICSVNDGEYTVSDRVIIIVEE